MLGDPAVGKTSILSSYCSVGQLFPKDYVSVFYLMQKTIADIHSKIVSIDEDRDVELFFFDVAGQDIYTDLSSPLVILDNQFHS